MAAIQRKKNRIEDLCVKVTSGGTPSRKKPEFYTGSIPWIKTGELNGWFINDTGENITDEAIAKSSAKIYPKNTVLMAMYGDGRTIGSVGITNIEAASNQASCAMIADPEKCSPLYLLYLLQHHREAIVKLALGGAQRNLNQGTIKNYELDVPELNEQKNIADILSTYDYLIENNNRRITILEEMAQSLYREWFVKFRFSGYQDCEFKESSLGLIPEEWEVVQIKDIGEVITGKTPSKKKPEYYSTRDVPFLKTPDMHGSIFVTFIEDWLSKEGADSQKNKYIPAGSVSVACIGAKAGVVALIPTSVQTNQQINSVVFYDSRMREYFYLFASGFTELIRALGSSGATMTNVSKGKFEAIELIKPIEAILGDFHNTISSHFNMIMNLQKKNEKLKKARDVLLPKLISGNISLKEYYNHVR